jgi:DNA excision repair protein ERCC-3
VLARRGALAEALAHEAVRKLVTVDARARVPDEHQRGSIKQALIKIGYPVDDRGGYLDGDPFRVALRSARARRGRSRRGPTRSRRRGVPRGGSVLGGNGVSCCRAARARPSSASRVMSLVGEKTLILTTNTVAVRQWREELLDKTELAPERRRRVHGRREERRAGHDHDLPDADLAALEDRRLRALRPVLARELGPGRLRRGAPACRRPIFRVTADAAGAPALGLTATLVREDGKEDEVFCLIGPKRFDVPWKVLEDKGFIATAHCTEVRVPLDSALKQRLHVLAARAQVPRREREPRPRRRRSSSLIERHPRPRPDDRAVHRPARGARGHLQAPLITGKTPNVERESCTTRFRPASDRC